MFCWAIISNFSVSVIVVFLDGVFFWMKIRCFWAKLCASLGGSVRIQKCAVLRDEKMKLWIEFCWKKVSGKSSWFYSVSVMPIGRKWKFPSAIILNFYWIAPSYLQSFRESALEEWWGIFQLNESFCDEAFTIVGPEIRIISPFSNYRKAEEVLGRK